MKSLANHPMKNLICKEAEKMTRSILKTLPELEDCEIDKCCLLYSHCVVAVAKQIPGFESVQIQGGSASWRIVPLDKDNGVSPTHYSYIFEAGKAWRQLVDGGGIMPEVHFWAAVPPKKDLYKKGLIIDLTPKYVPKLALFRGLRCLTKLPDVVWALPDELPENCDGYRADYYATEMGYVVLGSILGDKP